MQKKVSHKIFPFPEKKGMISSMDNARSSAFIFNKLMFLNRETFVFAFALGLMRDLASICDCLGQLKLSLGLVAHFNMLYIKIFFNKVKIV